MGQQKPDPTPEEIERACERIRSTWTPETRAARACRGAEPRPVEMPIAREADLGVETWDAMRQL